MTSATVPSAPTPLLIDAHVHLHDCFDLTQFLTAARTNFQRQRERQSLPSPGISALLLAEVSGVNAFSQLSEGRETFARSLADWDIFPTEEACSLRFVHRSGDTLLILAGRQVVTSEKIEALALINEANIDDGLSLADTLAAIAKLGALPVLPWGVGKWVGKRGQIVEAQLRGDRLGLFGGDNGGRPSFWPLPGFLSECRQLPGTDPLPLSWEVSRAGSYGFSTQGQLDWAKPGESLKRILLDFQSPIQAYGRPQSPWKFIKNQTLLRVS